MIGQGSYNVKPLSPSAPSSDPYGSEVLGAPFTNASCPPTPAALLPTPGDLRWLAKLAPHPTHLLKCPRCDSPETKFCYYNNYSLSQPRYFCKNCKRYWTAGGVLRNVPVGGGLRKNKRCKLKLQAEAEAAAAAAACELAGQEALDQLQQHYEANNPQSPVLASSSAMGSSSTSCASSIVSGMPANFVIAAAPAMIRTSSGSDASSVEYAGNDNCGSVGAGAGAYGANQQQNGNQLQHFFGELCAAQTAVPQFYSSYSTSLPPSNLQEYRGTPSERGASYHEGGGNVCSNDLKQEKEEIINANLQYDWQLISESLFNAAAVDGFLPPPGGSWSDFSQFQDPSGPAG